MPKKGRVPHPASSVLSPEAALCCAIVRTALADARGTGRGHSISPLERIDARKWIKDGTELRTLLNLLNLDAEVICKQMQKAVGV